MIISANSTTAMLRERKPGEQRRPLDFGNLEEGLQSRFLLRALNSEP